LTINLTRDEFRIVLSVLAHRYAEEVVESPAKDDLRSAIEKIAEEIGYVDGAINAILVKIKMKKGTIKGDEF
jgi:hypothetical protein